MAGKQSEYKRPRVIFMCSEETKDALQKWAKREKRTLSNMIERIVDEALAQEKTIDTQTQTTIDTGAEAISFLKKMGSGKRPNSIERASLADSLEIDVEILDRLVDCIFDEKREVNHGG